MARYIDAEKIKYHCDSGDCDGDCRHCELNVIVEKSKVDAIPTADVQEVKHGLWKLVPVTICNGTVAHTEFHFECSQCKHCAGHKSKYCPDCGAKMDKEE